MFFSKSPKILLSVVFLFNVSFTGAGCKMLQGNFTGPSDSSEVSFSSVSITDALATHVEDDWSYIALMELTPDIGGTVSFSSLASLNLVTLKVNAYIREERTNYRRTTESSSVRLSVCPYFSQDGKSPDKDAPMRNGWGGWRGIAKASNGWLIKADLQNGFIPRYPEAIGYELPYVIIQVHESESIENYVSCDSIDFDEGVLVTTVFEIRWEMEH